MSKGGSHYVQHPAGETGDSNGEPLLFSANPKKIKYNTSFSMNAHHSMSRHYWLHYCCTFFFCLKENLKQEWVKLVAASGKSKGRASIA